MCSKRDISRRDFIKTSSAASIAAGVAVSSLSVSANAAQKDNEKMVEKIAVNGKIKQSVCKWCYGGIPLEEFAAFCVKIGIRSIELVGPQDWPILKKHGLICAMSPGGSLTEGLAHTKNHEKCLLISMSCQHS